MANHTKGPWTVDETKALGAYGVWTDYATHPGYDGAGYGSQICSVLPESEKIPREQRDANARLIAAAPDLLASLQEMVAELLAHATLGLNESEVAMLKRAEDAIARATN